MDILIMGGPGVGKDMMPVKIVEKLNINHISTGDIFRNEIGKETALDMEAKSFMDKELLVPDEAVNNMAGSYLEKSEDKKNGFLLDGYPRTLDQVRAFDVLAEGSELAIDKVVALEIDSEKLADCVTGCRICKECGEIYHIKLKPSRTDNICGVRDGELFQRKDDIVESLTVRLEEYSLQIAPVLDCYSSKGIVTRIDVSQSIDSVWNNTLTALEK